MYQYCKYRFSVVLAHPSPTRFHVPIPLVCQLPIIVPCLIPCFPFISFRPFPVNIRLFPTAPPCDLVLMALALSRAERNDMVYNTTGPAAAAAARHVRTGLFQCRFGRRAAGSWTDGSFMRVQSAQQQRVVSTRFLSVGLYYPFYIFQPNVCVNIAFKYTYVLFVCDSVYFSVELRYVSLCHSILGIFKDIFTFSKTTSFFVLFVKFYCIYCFCLYCIFQLIYCILYLFHAFEIYEIS